MSNTEFNLVSVLYHALEGGQTYSKYIQDAQSDQELVQFFQQIQQEDNARAQKAMQLLSSRRSS
jgi:type III secretory pathway component EscR